MIITKANKNDLDAIMTIVNEAKAYLKSTDTNQWQDGYPNEDSFINDINEDRLYVCKDSDLVVGVFAKVTYEPTYDKIYEGSWNSDTDYVAIHRIAVRQEYKGKGVAKFIFDELKKTHVHIRVDTHTDNKNMNRCLIKNGFKYCGIIYLERNAESDNKRLAYEYIK